MKPISHILYFIFLHIATVTFAQDAVKRTHFGFSVTPSLSKPILDAEADTEVSAQLSWNFGGDFYYDLTGKTQLKSGLFFSQTKVSYIDYSPSLPGDVVNGEFFPRNSYWDADYALWSIGLPLEIKLKLGQPTATNHLFLVGGINIQYLINSTGENDLISNEQLVAQISPEDFPFEATTFRSSLAVGIGYEFAVGKRKCLVSPVYEYGLSKLYTVEASAEANLRLSGFGVRLACY